MGTTQFASSLGETGFIPPVSLEEGLARTLRYEFLEDNSDKRTFEMSNLLRHKSVSILLLPRE
jgi:hypothetical protein